LRLPSGHRVLHFESIDSTNAEARRLAEAGERGPLWILADEQTAGRGRLGRTWVSRPGNFYGTLLLATEADAAAATQLGFVAALSVLHAVAGVTGKVEAKFGLKWPNDVLIEGAKFCGLLSEIVCQSPMTVAIGCGINLAHAPEGVSYPVAALGLKFTPEQVLSTLDSVFAKWLGVWEEGHGFPSIRAAWEENGPARGQSLTVDGVNGSFAGLAEDGALRLRLADGAVKLIHAGDVRMGAMA
jgi:BirA family transcriptional regulator, biotin operon repressor / biotin---[acetyl-CoA-carboxylase] ligase